MQQNSQLKQTIIKWSLILIVWTLVAVIFTFNHSLSSLYKERAFSTLGFFSVQVVSCLGWVILTPIVIWTAKRFLPEGKEFYKNIILLSISGLGIVLFQTAYQAFFLPMLGYPAGQKFSSFSDAYKSMFVSNALLSLMIYVISLGIILVGAYYRKYQSRELLSSKLEANLTRAKLQVLKMQLHPHFLFNTHNAISELIHKDPETAEKMLTNLSDLLRISLEGLEVEEVLLQKELEFVEKYIEIEQIRFQERLQFQMNISPETLDAIVPNMLLQPLIENAVRHGITPLKEGGRIEVNSYKKHDQLYLEVADNGIGVSEDSENLLVKGIGLANIESRLLYLYKEAQSFEINSNNKKGFSVLLKIPFKTKNIKETNLGTLNMKLARSN